MISNFPPKVTKIVWSSNASSINNKKHNSIFFTIQFKKKKRKKKNKSDIKISIEQQQVNFFHLQYTRVYNR